MAKKKNKVKKERIVDILHESTKVKTDVSVVILRYNPKFLIDFLEDISDDFKKGKVLQISHSSNAIVMICEEFFAREIEKKYEDYVIKHHKNLVALTLMFPKKARKTPGILSFLTDLFSKNKINIAEIISTYTEITFVFPRKDLSKAKDLIKDYVL